MENSFIYIIFTTVWSVLSTLTTAFFAYRANKRKDVKGRLDLIQEMKVRFEESTSDVLQKIDELSLVRKELAEANYALQELLIERDHWKRECEELKNNSVGKNSSNDVQES